MQIDKQIDMYTDEQIQMQIVRHIDIVCCMLCRKRAATQQSLNNRAHSTNFGGTGSQGSLQ
eukprot:570942-Pyramimonas_sp.AAC.1